MHYSIFELSYINITMLITDPTESVELVVFPLTFKNLALVLELDLLVISIAIVSLVDYIHVDHSSIATPRRSKVDGRD